jgi:plastocyanin
MRTGLLRYYGKKDTVQEYIDVVIRHLRLPSEVRDTALSMYNYIAKNSSVGGLAPSMQAMTLVKLAAERKNRRILVKEWDNLASYKNLLKHSNDFKKILYKWQETKVSDIKRVVIPPNFTNPELEINYFIPRFVKVLKGQKVEWVNLDTHAHNLIFFEVLRDGETKLRFGIGKIEKKEKSTPWKFDYDLSRMDYRCTLHDNEIGTIVIYPTPEEMMTNKEQFEFLSEIFDVKPAPSLSHLASQ